jgi:FixJ family two-component response regulator
MTWSNVFQATKNIAIRFTGRKKTPVSPGSAVPFASPTILTIALDDTDVATVERSASLASWKVRQAMSFAHALILLEREEVPIIICDSDLRGRDWRDVARALTASNSPPCVVIASPVIDSNLCAEVVHWGGYDVIAKPISEVDLVRTVNMAWSFWRSSKLASGLIGNHTVARGSAAST